LGIFGEERPYAIIPEEGNGSDYLPDAL
jgi:hypothetical protein